MLLNYFVKRFSLAIPMFLTGMLLAYSEFKVLWQGTGLLLQIIAIGMLWSASVLLMKGKQFFWLCTFVSMLFSVIFVCSLLYSTVFGLGLPFGVSIVSSCLLTLLVSFFIFSKLLPNQSLIHKSKVNNTDR